MQPFSKLRTVLLGAVFSAITLGPVAHADDTEIFFGQSKDSFNTNPNILFILDTSGSMGSWDDAGKSRIDRMKIAMRVLLRESSRYNVGLMGFSGTYRGGSIHYPVGDLEKDSGSLCENGICPDERIVVKPESGQNDATEHNETGDVILDADSLTMGQVTTSSTTDNDNRTPDVAGSAYAVAVVAESENNDGTESTRTITSSANWFYNGTADSNDDRYAYRFENISIPNGAVVTSATLTFSQTSAAAQTGNLSALVKVEAAANATALPDAVNGFDTIADRLITATRGVQWNNIAPDTTIGAAASDSLKSVTPDLSEIVNLVVTLPNWQADNALNFILDPVDEYVPSPADIREMHGIDAVESLLPVLNYTYNTSVSSELITTVSTATSHVDEIEDQTNNVLSRHLVNPATRLFYAADTHFPRKVAFRFEDIDIPENADIQSATLILNSTLDDSIEEDIDQWQSVNATPTNAPGAGNGTAGLGSGTAGTNNAGGGTAQNPNNSTGDETVDLSADDENSVTININAETTGTPAPYTASALASRAFTNSFTPWEITNFTPGEEMTSPNMANVIAAVIQSDTWVSGQSLSLMLSAPPNYNDVVENSGLIDTTSGPVKPQLQIVWKPSVTTDTTATDSQTTAIRFANVHVPPEATIKSARLVFTSSEASIDPIELNISAEKNSASAAFAAVPYDLNRPGRTRTDEKEPWIVPAWDLPDTKYNSIDFKDVVQEVINLPEWCGGNPLTIFLEKKSGTGSRSAISADRNSVVAPSLELTYEPGSVKPGSYCSNATVISSIDTETGDGVEDLSNNVVDLTAGSLDTINPGTGASQLIGLRFSSLGVPKDAVVVSATLVLTHEKDITQPQAYTFSAIKTLASPEFGQGNVSISHSDRVPYTTTVTASTQPGVAVDTRFRVDVQPLITAKVNDPDWVPGSPLIITAKALGTVAQSFSSRETNEAQAPQLIIYYQSEREKPGTVYRDNLISIVDSMVAQSGTPIVSSLYEAAQYYSGKKVVYGLQRGSRSSDDRFHRVSHPLSYTDGVVDREPECTDANLSASQCRYERILNENGNTPTYISPLESECQQNHIVLLSDGVATSNTAKQKVRELINNQTCAVLGNQECGVELASWLFNTDISASIAGDQNVTTHTIGFNLDHPQFLEDLAEAGGGSYYSADSSSQLLNAFKNIFINVSKTDTSFVAPSATVSQSNRLKNREDIYFSLFKPEGTARWAGNLKRYRLGGTSGETADILDVNDVPAVDESTGQFFSTAKSYWSKVVDGDSVLLGGAAEQLEANGVSHLARNVYTYTGHNTDLTNEVYNELLPTNIYINRDWLKLTATLAADDEYVENMLYWAHGKDVFDIDGDSDKEEARAQMGDPMHSQPLLVNYVGDRSVVHVATNEGYLHAIDHNTGQENFAFFPKELLPNLRRIYENQVTTSRPYGLDGGMTLWIDDDNDDGVVDPATDKAYLYIGMRRGGNLYYALDITDPDAPKYLWSIAGGSNTVDSDLTTADGDFVELGQTWSKPIKSRIYDNAVLRDVLIFGAGYGSNQDPFDEVDAGPIAAADPSLPAEDNRQTRETDSVGRGFFIVDAKTGEEIWHTDQTFFPEMKYSVPTELRVIDINFDGLADQIYFGDMGGQVWRFDYNNDPAISVNVDNRMNGGRIAQFAGDTPESARRFYYPPDIAILSVDGEQQLSVSIGSGWRAHPLDTVVEDRFYSFRMTQVYGAPTTEDGDVRYPEITESTTGMIELSSTDELRTTNKNEKGWFLPLGNGEKVLSSSVTIDNTIIFTSYVPSDESGSCDAAIGSGAVFFLDLATGNPVKNLDKSGETTESTTAEEPEALTARDRRRALLAPGIPPKISIMFPELNEVTGFAGRDKLDEFQVEFLKKRTFWQEHIEENL